MTRIYLKAHKLHQEYSYILPLLNQYHYPKQQYKITYVIITKFRENQEVSGVNQMKYKTKVDKQRYNIIEKNKELV